MTFLKFTNSIVMYFCESELDEIPDKDFKRITIITKEAKKAQVSSYTNSK